MWMLLFRLLIKSECDASSDNRRSGSTVRLKMKKEAVLKLEGGTLPLIWRSNVTAAQETTFSPVFQCRRPF